MEKKSEAYKKAEAKMAIVLFFMFVVWCPVYLFVVRPQINASLAFHLGSYPAMLHLIPILAPIVIVAVVMGKLLPKKDG